MSRDGMGMEMGSGRGRPSGWTGRARGRSITTGGPAIGAGIGVLLLLWFAPWAAAPAWANGGTLRLANVQMGAYRVSVFTDPTPVRPDSLDVSVLVTQEAVPRVPQDLQVRIRTRPLDHAGNEEEREATREAADDPRYYSAKFALGTEGHWEVQVSVAGPSGEGSASFQLRARERGLLGHPLTLTLLALLPLGLVTLWIFREGTGDDGPSTSSMAF